MTQKPSTLTQDDLRQFIGTEFWYRHAIQRHILFTDGAKYVADTAGAYWLLDEIALGQREPCIANQPFQRWTLTVHPDHTATLLCEDGNCHAVFIKAIEYTDFPLEKISFYFTDNVILLPSEY
jgi:hypothetical protein